jgi:hypothetical protein
MVNWDISFDILSHIRPKSLDRIGMYFGEDWVYEMIFVVHPIMFEMELWKSF